MFTVDVSINLFTLFCIVLSGIVVGYFLRSRQLRKKQMKIAELRKEMVRNHAHILELQKEYVELELQIRAAKTPVLPLKPVIKEYMEEEKRVAEGRR